MAYEGFFTAASQKASATTQGYYAEMPAADRAEVALEMAQEVLEHYDHARALIASLVSELQKLGAQANASQHVAAVVDAWINDAAHVAQERRLVACLEAALEQHAEVLHA